LSARSSFIREIEPRQFEHRPFQQTTGFRGGSGWQLLDRHGRALAGAIEKSTEQGGSLNHEKVHERTKRGDPEFGKA
jgi:hypothetical protein